MSDAIRELHDYLAKSPSLIYPEDVLAYLPAIEAENAKLRKLVVLGIMLPLNEEQMDWLDKTFVSEFGEGLYVQLEKLGIEVTK